jgi:hypothetical protein
MPHPFLSRLRATRLLLVWLVCAVAAAPAAAQEGLRVGVSVGGTGLVGIVGEWRWDDHGVELQLSTFSFRDIGISAVGKQYFGASWLKPTVGAGLWLVSGRSPEGTGRALMARFPLGGDWRAAPGHYATFEMNVNRGLWMRRADPTDTRPMSRRMIPIPSVSYRYDPE